MRELLNQLCTLNGVSGDEEHVRDFILDEIRSYADTVRVDVLGNLIVTKKGKASAPSHLMLCAHMDEVGIIVTHITDEGYLKFDFVGGVDRRVVIGKSVSLGDNHTMGVIGIKAYHLVSRDEEKKIPKTSTFYIDIGADSREEAEEKVTLGTYGTFVTECETMGDGLFKAKAIDDRLGCAIMMELLKEELPMDVTFAFTAQEEVGTRGAFAAAFSVKPEIALVLETTTAADLPAVPDQQKVCKVGNGPVISYMDGSTIYNRPLYERLRTIAERETIPWQTKEYLSGGNDSRAIQRTRDGVRVCVISAPIRYLHAPASVGSWSDFEYCLSLTRFFIADVAESLEEMRDKHGNF